MGTQSQRPSYSEHGPSLPKSIDLRILGKCNLACPFCFGPRHEISAAKVKDMIAILPELRSRGTEVIVITGGEPMMARQLPQLVQRAHEIGLRIVLSTNGTLVERRHREVLPYIDWIALPLDGPSSEVHDTVRPGQVRSFDAVLRSLELCRSEYPKLMIKLGTVVSRQNFEYVSQIPSVVHRSAGKPDVWRIYQTSFSNYGKDNQETLELSEGQFESTVQQMEDAAKAVGWRTSIYRNSDRSGKYLFMEPRGEAMVIADGEERIVGNFFENLEQVETVWSEFVDADRLSHNVTSAYPME